MPPYRRPRNCRCGFSLIELLTVLLIIGILSSVMIGVVFTDSGSAAMPAAQRTLASMLSSARTTAMLNNSNAYLLIYGDNGSIGTATGTDPQKYLRFMGVVYEDPDSTSTLIPANSGAYLPQGCYFTPGDSTDGPGDNVVSSDLPTVSVAFPNPSGTANTWYAIGFDKNGETLTSSESNLAGYNPSGRSFELVIRPSDPPEPGSWPLDPSDSSVAQGQFDALGIFVRPQGRSMMMNDFEEIETN